MHWHLNLLMKFQYQASRFDISIARLVKSVDQADACFCSQWMHLSKTSGFYVLFSLVQNVLSLLMHILRMMVCVSAFTFISTSRRNFLEFLFFLLQVPSTEIFYSLNATIVGLAVSSEESENLPWCVGLGRLLLQFCHCVQVSNNGLFYLGAFKEHTFQIYIEIKKIFFSTI